MAALSTRSINDASLSEPQLFTSFVSIAAGLNFGISRDYGTSVLVSKVNSYDLGFLSLGLSIIGRGSSFSVSAIPTASRQGHFADDQLDVVAFKQTVPGTRSENADSKKRRIRDIMLELRVLCHDPIRKHENVVKLLGIAWETDPFSRYRRWPFLVLERASHGTLAEYLQTLQSLSSKEKINLSLDTLYGLEILHLCHIFHGDLKLENVLIFSNEDQQDDRPVIAKLADFGGALHDVQTQAYLTTPTKFWAAPEAQRAMDIEQLPKSDVYALGFLIWRIFAHGRHPFLDGDAEIDETARITAESCAEALKLDDARILGHLMSLNDLCLPNEKPVLQCILEHTVRAGSSSRNLREAKGILEAESTNSRQTPFERDLASHQYFLEDQLVKFDFQGIEALDPTLIRYLSLELTREAEASSHDSIGHEAAYGLAVMHLNGIVPTDDNASGIDIGLDWLRKAALAGNSQARAFIYRIHKAFGRDLPEGLDDEILSWLSNAVWNGFFTAIEDLTELRQFETREAAKYILRTRYGGTGAKKFADLHSPFASTSSYESGWVEQLSLERWDRNIQNNALGDKVLHLATSWDLRQITARLLGESVDDINSVNIRDETPLLLACRCGNYHIAMLLLEAGADPRIVNHTGDSPLHWLISFDEAQAVDLCNKILQRGVEIDAHARKWNYTFPGDNIFVEGTPLMRAVSRNRIDIVQILLAAGANPELDVGGGSAIELAALLHYPKILALLLEHSQNDNPAIGLGEENPLLNAILRGGCLESPGSLFGRMRRHGQRWASDARESLQVVISNGARAQLEDLPGSAGVTALVLAVHLSQSDIVEAILEIGGSDFINRCCNAPNITSESCTPLIEAVWMKKYSTFQLLLTRGANPQAFTDVGDGVCLSLLHECARASNADRRFPQMLIERGVSVNNGPEGYETPLACALRRRCFSLAEVLLDNGADINIEFNTGFDFEENVPKTVLGFLLQECSLSSLACLEFIFGHDPNPANFLVRRSSNFSVLHVLANVKPSKQDDRALRIILDLVLNAFEPEQEQLDLIHADTEFSALHIAALNANYVVVERLFREGASTRVECQGGLLPFHAACWALQEFPRTYDLTGLVVPKQTFLPKFRKKLERVVNFLEENTPD